MLPVLGALLFTRMAPDDKMNASARITRVKAVEDYTHFKVATNNAQRGNTARVWSASSLLTLWRTSKIELTERVPSKWIPSGGTRSGGVETSQDTRRTRARSKATRPNRAALRQANVEPESGTAVVRLPPKRTASKKLSEVVIVIVS